MKTSCSRNCWASCRAVFATCSSTNTLRDARSQTWPISRHSRGEKSESSVTISLSILVHTVWYDEQHVGIWMLAPATAASVAAGSFGSCWMQSWTYDSSSYAAHVQERKVGVCVENDDWQYIAKL